MKLFSCHSCGIVLNSDQIAWPEIHTPDGVVTEKAIWTGREFVPTIECPVCKQVLEKPN